MIFMLYSCVERIRAFFPRGIEKGGVAEGKICMGEGTRRMKEEKRKLRNLLISHRDMIYN